jgi:hypothetical protein
MSGAARLAAACLVLAFSSAACAATKARPASAPAAAASAPTEFGGQFEVDRIYVADVAYDANALHVWRPVKAVQVAPNTAWTVEWTNLAQFPALAGASARARPQRFRFKVLKAEVSSGSPAMPWTAIYRCELLAVEAAAGASPGAGKRR